MGLGTHGAEVDVVDPDLAGRLDADGVARGGEHLLDLDVADDDVALVEHAQADADQRYWVMIMVISGRNENEKRE